MIVGFEPERNGFPGCGFSEFEPDLAGDFRDIHGHRVALVRSRFHPEEIHGFVDHIHHPVSGFFHHVQRFDDVWRKIVAQFEEAWNAHEDGQRGLQVVAHDAVDLLAEPDVFYQDLVLALEIDHGLAERQMRCDPRLDDPRINRLCYIIHRSALETLFLVDGIVLRGDEDDGDASGLLLVLQDRANLVAIQTGHHDVKQDEVGRLVAGCDRQRFCAGRGGFDAISGEEDAPEHFDIVRNIVDDQNGLLDFVIHRALLREGGLECCANSRQTGGRRHRRTGGREWPTRFFCGVAAA
ncbi:MAG: hypothetical protein BWY66_02221 [bacterium ADurb.Bin374]|nr:MAG: hypothetical protein BWY66_02221 [bacterium ADurb.Bin374]